MLLLVVGLLRRLLVLVARGRVSVACRRALLLLLLELCWVLLAPIHASVPLDELLLTGGGRWCGLVVSAS